MCRGNTLWINIWERLEWPLELLKTMYGLNDGPLAFPFCLSDFYCEDMGAHQSQFDKKFYFWM